MWFLYRKCSSVENLLYVVTCNYSHSLMRRIQSPCSPVPHVGCICETNQRDFLHMMSTVQCSRSNGPTETQMRIGYYGLCINASYRIRRMGFPRTHSNRKTKPTVTNGIERVNIQLTAWFFIRFDYVLTSVQVKRNRRECVIGLKMI